ncbi:hypothetical protein J1614_003473 [Plenodomus biglobosus]|nr:hypothetical protein J1614_003473 [Plenodomus biglobosus]
MCPHSTVLSVAPQMRNQEEHSTIGSHYDTPDTSIEFAEGQYPDHHKQHAQIMAMLDEHLAFTQAWTPELEGEAEFEFTPQTATSLSWRPEQHERPTSSGTMFVDWDDDGALVVSYRNGPPEHQRRPPAEPQRRGSDEGDMRISYRDHVLGSRMLSEGREEYMGPGVCGGAYAYEEALALAQSRYDDTPSPLLTPQALRMRLALRTRRAQTPPPPQSLRSPSSHKHRKPVPVTSNNQYRSNGLHQQSRRHVAPAGRYLEYQLPIPSQSHGAQASHNRHHQVHPAHTHHQKLQQHSRPTFVPPVLDHSKPTFESTLPNHSSSLHHNYNSNLPTHQTAPPRPSAHHLPSYPSPPNHPSPTPAHHHLRSKSLPNLVSEGVKKRNKFTGLMKTLLGGLCSLAGSNGNGSRKLKSDVWVRGRYYG